MACLHHPPQQLVPGLQSGSGPACDSRSDTIHQAALTRGISLRAWIAGALAAVCLASGCSSSPPAGSAPSAPAVPSLPASASPVSAGAVKAQALAAYLGRWRAYVTASHTADYQSVSLARYAAGDALSVLTHGLYENYKQGVITRGQPSLNPHASVVFTSGAPVSASVTDCASSTNWRDYDRSGRPAGTSPPGRRRITAQLALFYGSWKVTYLVVGRPGTC